jgi:hypothetical protein
MTSTPLAAGTISACFARRNTVEKASRRHRGARIWQHLAHVTRGASGNGWINLINMLWFCLSRPNGKVKKPAVHSVAPEARISRGDGRGEATP